MSSIAVLICLIALVMINVPIGIAIGAVALVGMVATSGIDAIYNAALAMFEGGSKFTLLSIPLFVFAGALMNTGGISLRLINFVNAIVGFVRGGLSMVNVGVSMIFAEISGSAVADVAALFNPYPSDEKTRLFRQLLSGGNLIIGVTCGNYPSITADDHLRCNG
ncbi:TRAP-type C4-dicarboxylate transport system [Vibrio sp. JCM 19236]|nr:TRAP-type C4-dicarboxylate transport system [Vibrio sp. JCM 19236]